ncbi:MAG: ribonuclease III, partial [Chloroflexi bacterium]|nr:ribonuclease III [Chloroflexota bacterium]
LLQGTMKQTPLYRVVDAQGPEHERRFTVEVLLGDSSLARGVGRSKREAEQAAARQALERLREGQSVPSS